MHCRRCFAFLSIWLVVHLSQADAQPGKEFTTVSNRVSRARVADDGTMWLLSIHADVVRQYAPDGSSIGFFSLDESDGASPRTLLDFALDQRGRLFGLFFKPHADKRQTETIVARFEEKAPHLAIRLDKPVAAWKIEIDQTGDIYLLGLETGIYWRMIANDAGGETAYLVHRYDAGGRWKASYLPVTIPDSQAEIGSRILDPIYARSSFLVEGPGRVWFLRTIPDISRPVWDWDRKLYLATDSGAESELPAPPSDDFFLIGLHHDGDRVGLEWNSKSNPQSKLLTDTRGRVVNQVSLLGLLVACGPGHWYAEMNFGANLNQVLQARR